MNKRPKPRAALNWLCSNYTPFKHHLNTFYFYFMKRSLISSESLFLQLEMQREKIQMNT